MPAARKTSTRPRADKKTKPAKRAQSPKTRTPRAAKKTSVTGNEQYNKLIARGMTENQARAFSKQTAKRSSKKK